MIKQLTLKCFRKHEDLVLNLTPGLNALRGSNEAGKSTIIEGVLYALYGSKALRNSLAETATWGKREQDVSSKLIIQIKGVDFTFSRSKSGAECSYGDKLVTGQVEVSNFATELLGADAKTAAVLMLAGQNDLRGALDEGPAAVSALMSKLADFDTVDRLLETANNELTLGADAPLRSKIETAQAELVTLEAGKPDVSEIPSIDAGVLAAETQIKDLELAVESSMVVVGEKNTLVESADAANALRLNVSRKLDAARTALASTVGRIESAEKEAGAKPDPAELDALRAAAGDEVGRAKAFEAYSLFTALTYPGVFWEGPKSGFDAEVERLTKVRESIQADVAKLEGSAATLRAQLITSGKCPTCGHAAQSDEHVAEHNAGINVKLAEVVAGQTPLAAALKANQAELADMRAVSAVAASVDAKVMKVGLDYLNLDTSVYPSRPTWKAEVPERSSNANRTRLAELEAADRAAGEALGRAQAFRATAGDQRAAVAVLETEFGALVEVDVAPLRAEADAAYNAYATHSRDLLQTRSQLTDLIQRRVNLERTLQEYNNRLQTLRDRITEYQDDMKTLAFNNGLVAKLRRLKPAITDHLWGTVLSAVSTFFTSMRGEHSVVTKDASGFKVNGYAITSLSGSTLDVLAVAVRVALVKTFIPHTSFLTLDEPASGCDVSRTSNLLGFLAATGTEQVLLASHDELSESVADNVIQLGA